MRLLEVASPPKKVDAPKDLTNINYLHGHLSLVRVGL